MARFWEDLGKINVVSMFEKMLMGKSSDGVTMYCDVQQLYDTISTKNFQDVKPSVVSSGTNLGTPSKLTAHVVSAGTYITPAGNVTVMGNINFFFWDLSSWTYIQFDVAVKDNTVTSAKIVDGSVNTVKLADASVSTGKIVDLSVSSAKIADGAILEIKLANGAVTTVKLADGAVSTSKIIDLAVTGAKVALDAITTSKILDLAVTAAKIASNAVVESKLADYAVTAIKIATGAVTNAKLADDSISTPKIQDNAVTPLKTTMFGKSNNPDYALPIVDALNKLLGYFDEKGNLHFNVKLQKDNIDEAMMIKDSTITLEKLSAQIQELLNILSVFSPLSKNESDAGFLILDSLRKILVELTETGHLKALFDYSMSKINRNDFDNETKLGVFLADDFDPEFDEYFFYIAAGRKVLLGFRPDGTTTTLDTKTSSIGLKELQQEVKLLVGNNVIECDGDSLTRGGQTGTVRYPNILQTLMPEYEVVNKGVGGEDVPTISARIGGIPAIITEAFTLPADTSTVEISSLSNIRLKNTLGVPVNLLRQTPADDIVNPCYIEGVECTLTYTSSTYYIRRNAPSTSIKLIRANSFLYLRGNREYRDSAIKIIWMGQNGGFDNDPDLFVKYVDACINYHRKSNFIIIGLHTNTPVYRSALEAKCVEKYGNKYINMREYSSGNMMYDLGLTPTSEDLIYMENGLFPPSLWASPTDSTHGNNYFYTGVAYKAKEIINQLGY